MCGSHVRCRHEKHQGKQICDGRCGRSGDDHRGGCHSWVSALAGPAVRAPVLEQLGDPDAAKFRNERFVGPWAVADGVLCGEVNARNRTGGHDGYQLFLSAGGKAHIEPESVRETMAKARGGRPGHEQECTPSMLSENVKWWWLRW